MVSHESSIKTGFFSSHQRLAFPCVWASIMHRTGVPAPPHASLPPWEVKQRQHHKRKMVGWSPNDLPAKLPWGGLMGSYDFFHGHLLENPPKRGKTLCKVMWLWTSEGTHMCGGGSNINSHWCWQIVNPKIDVTTHQTGSWLARPNKGEWNG